MFTRFRIIGLAAIVVTACLVAGARARGQCQGFFWTDPDGTPHYTETCTVPGEPSYGWQLYAWGPGGGAEVTACYDYRAPYCNYADTAPAPDSCGDERDTIIAEYQTYSVAFRPFCSSFSSIGVNEFNHGEDNSHQPWALIDDIVYLKRAQIQEYALYQLRITSGYRCPHINASLPDAALNSHHMRGDALDMTPPLDRYSPPTESEFDHLRNAAVQTNPRFITSWDTYPSNRHLHAQWR